MADMTAFERQVGDEMRRTRRLVEEVFSGEYHSVFKGTGMEFREVREYVPGDDVRSIDWNVTARTDEPFVKLYEEERELTVILAVDMSRSGWFGSGRRSKVEVAAELANTRHSSSELLAMRLAPCRPVQADSPTA